MRVQWRRHPAEDVLLEVLEGTADPDARNHVSGCEACRARVAAAQEVLGLSRDAEVPEPPPLYWEGFRRQLGREIEGTEVELRTGLHRWWPAIAAAAVVVAALGIPRSSVAPVPPSTAVAPVPAWSALPPAAEDSGLGVLSGLASAGLSLTAECRDAADCVAGLTDEESRALTEALRGEIRGGVL